MYNVNKSISSDTGLNFLTSYICTHVKIMNATADSIRTMFSGIHLQSSLRSMTTCVFVFSGDIFVAFLYIKPPRALLHLNARVFVCSSVTLHRDFQIVTRVSIPFDLNSTILEPNISKRPTFYFYFSY